MEQTDNGLRPSALAAEDNVQQLIDALMLWTSNMTTNPDVIVHCLAHSKEAAELGLKKLQAEDETQVRCLEGACAKVDVVLYLVDLEWRTQQREGETYDERDDLEEDRFQFITLTGIRGDLLAKDMEIGVEHPLQANFYSEDRERDEDEERKRTYHIGIMKVL